MKEAYKKAVKYLAGADVSLIFLFLFAFCLPFSRRIEILSDYSLMDGKFMSYLTYLVYGFEFFLVLFLSFYIYDLLKSKENKIYFDKGVVLSLIALVIFSFISVFFAESKGIALYYTFILLALSVFYVFMANRIRNIRDIFVILNVFVFSSFIQSIIGILQYIKGSSIGLYILGESPISSALSGVAKIMVNGESHIRAYGTLSHPNILAAFLFVSGIFSIYLFSIYKDRFFRYVISFELFTILIALIITFSRVTWLLCVISFLGYFFYLLKSKFDIKGFFSKKNNIYISLAVLFLIVTVIAFLAGGIWWRVNPFNASTWESLRVRGAVFAESFEILRNNFFGVGAGGFIIELVKHIVGKPIWMAEPVHNIFLLIFSEIGALGLISFLSVLVCSAFLLKKSPVFLKFIFYGIIFLMFFDHYFWDIRNTQYLLFFVLSLITFYSRPGKN